MLFNPFEQFEIMLILPLHIRNIDISLTNLTILALVLAFLILIINLILTKSYTFLPNNWQIVMESKYNFVFNLLAEQTGPKGFRYFPHLLTVFTLILFYNLAGLIPFSFTVSSHIIITFTLALSFFVAWVIIGIKELKTEFLRVFCPRNMPAWLLPLLICIEFLSFSLRPISLGVRLFANMLAGHILLHILAGACLYLATVFVLASIPAYGVVTAIGFLELFIGFLQAYIFTILLGIYLKDSLHSH